MARKSSQSFVAPRGEDGKFIPRDQWPKKVQKEFDRLQKNGAFQGLKKNPIVKSSSGRRRGKNIWIPPHDKSGRFLPMSRWSQADKKAYRKALKNGLVPGSLVPRGHAGRFATDAAPRSRRSRGAPVTAIQVRPDDRMASLEDQDLFDVRRGIRRIEHRIEDLLFEIDDMRQGRGGGGRGVDVRQEPAPVCSSDMVFRPSDSLSQPKGRTDRYSPIRRDSRWGSFSPIRTGRTGGGALDPSSVDEHQDYEFYDDSLSYCDFGQEVEGSGADAYSRLLKCDDCQSEILCQVKKIGESCKSILGKAARGGDIKRNSSERLMMYNRPRVLGQRFEDVLGYLKKHPVVAIVGAGALALVGFAVYKMIRTIMSNIVAGASIRSGVMSFPGSTDYLITQDDSLWLIRAIWGEVNRSNQHWETSAVQRGSAAVMWALANNYMTVGRKRELFPTFSQFIQAYCQPINPIWASSGASGCQRNPGACSAETLAFRQALRSKPWNQFPAEAQALVTAFVGGALANPIGRRTDWAAAGQGRTTIDAVNVAGNVFITDPAARSRIASA